jgi:ADP-ribosyl-[dinitrogen reductase] hydrolase
LIVKKKTRRYAATLEGSLCKLLLDFFATNQLEFDSEKYLTKFVKFMTTPGSHNDTYSSTYLRQFFANQVGGAALSECADNDGHNTDAIDALTCLVPTTIAWSLKHNTAAALSERASLHATIARVLAATRRSSVLPRFGALFADMLVDLLQRDANESPAAALRRVAQRCGAQLGVDVRGAVERQYATSDPMVACYIESSFPAMVIHNIIVFIQCVCVSGFVD